MGTHFEEQWILHETLHGLEEEARERQCSALWQATLHAHVLAKVAIEVRRHLVYRPRHGLEAHEVGLMHLESSDEGQQHIGDLGDHADVGKAMGLESGGDLGMKVDDIVEPIEEPRDGHRDTLDPCSRWRPKR